jgi:glycosyltransferase involved in cell wall biosynthesis
MTRLLYISPGPMPPSSDPALDKFACLSGIADGDILLPICCVSPNSILPSLRETFPIYRVGSFCYHFYLRDRLPKPLRQLATFFFYLRCGLRLHREKKFDVIMTYGSNSTGIAGVFLKWMTGAKLIVEIPGVPEDAFRYEEPHPGIRASLKRFFADQLLVSVTTAADCMKLLYPWQLRGYPRLRNKKIAVFHDFVPVHAIRTEQAERGEDRFILLAGCPWYRKGVDVLIRAFDSIAAQFPQYKLKLLGYYPDREYLNSLTARCLQIEFSSPVPNELALKIIGACSVYVLASRSEAMGRVLLEAMAARKPILASAVNGVPYYIVNDDNGLLFQSENVEELATKLATLLSNPELQARLAARGYEKVFSEYDEQSYVRSFHSMLQSLRDESLADHKGIAQNEETMAATKSAEL